MVAFLSSTVGCSSDDDPTRPRAPAPDGPPIQLRDDAAAYGLLAPLMIEEARVDGRTLLLRVWYGGGCETHTFEAIGSTRFMESYPAQLTLYLRHDDGGDRCAAAILRDLSFDVTPAIELYRKYYGKDGPFYLRIVTPDASLPTLVRVP